MSADENLDVSVPKPKVSSAVDVAKTPAAKEDMPKIKTPVLTMAQEGLSTAQKLLFIAVIVVVCAFFLRSRGTQTSAVRMDGFKEKSMA